VIENMTNDELEALIVEFHDYACIVRKKRRGPQLVSGHR
jgi:hypothetical protein